MNKKERMLRLTFVLFFASIVLLVLAAGSENAKGRTITVDDSGGADYEKIQDAIDDTTEGDTIRVYEGTYYENVVVDETVSLIGNGSTNTTIDAEGSGRVVEITADWVNMSGFRVMNGSSGICLEWGSNNNTITNNVCEDNNYDHGIYIRGSGGNTLANNTCLNNEYHGIYLYYSQRNTITRNTCEDNDNGGGIYLFNSNYNMLTNNICSDNSQGIYLDSSNSNIISDNTCGNHYYDGISLWDSSNSNSILGNTCENNNNDGIYIQGSNDNTLSDNTCTDNDWCGIYLVDTANSTLSDNTCKYSAHGIYTNRFNNNTLSNNTCEDNGNSGIYIRMSDDNIFSNNICEYNAYGIWLEGSSANAIKDNIVSANKFGFLLRGSSKGNAVHYNTIFENSRYGINATSNGGETINATNNWWGHGSGPYHAVNNTKGSGDNVTDYVDFKPWSTYNFSKVLYVDDDAPDGGDGSKEKPYNKIQDAIDVAEEGDTIRVYEGTYYESVVVDETVNLIGNGSEETTIDAGGSGTVVSITADEVEMSGFTVRGSGNEEQDAGIRIESDDNSLFDNTCSNNDGDGIFLGEFSHAAITDNTCSNNGRDGIFLDEDSSATITNNFCTDNGYSGIDLFAYAGATITNNTCSNNGGSGIHIDYHSGGTITDNTCSNNDGSGIYIVESDYNTIENNICLNNGRTGIVLSESDNNTIENNVCSNNGRNGVVLEEASGGHNTLRFNIVTGNDVGVYFRYSHENTLEENIITNNRVGIYLEDYSESNTAHFNSISGNTEYGIDASDNEGYTIKATDNWWGHASGPYHGSKNTDGEGDNVTDYVDSDPWIRKPPFEDYTPPEATIDSVNPTDSLERQEVEFTGHGTAYESIEHYVWSSDLDGEFHNATDPDFLTTTLSNGTHTIHFRVQDNYGVWSEPNETTITVNGRPRAEIMEVSPSPALVGEKVKFKAQGMDDEDVVGHAWSSDIDGELYNGTEEEFETTSLSIGTHTITLKVEDDLGVWSEPVITTLIIHEKPIAVIESISPNPALDTDIIHFEGNGTDDGAIEAYNWRIVNETGGEVYNGTAPSAVQPPGTYTIYFSVRDNYDVWSDEVSGTLTIHTRPVAEIKDISPDPAFDTDTVDFRGQGTDDGELVHYSWWSSIDGDIRPVSTLHDYSLFIGSDHTLSDVHGEPEELFIPADYDEAPGVRFNKRWVDAGEWTLFASPEMNLRGDGSITFLIWYSLVDEGYGADAEFRFTLSADGVQLVQATGYMSNDPGDDRAVEYTVSGNLDAFDLPAGAELSLHIEYRAWEDCVIYLDDPEHESRLVLSEAEMLVNAPYIVVSSLSVGTHTITFKVQDNYGIWSEPATATLTVNEYVPPANKLPTVTITSPEDGAELKGTITIKGTATDEDGTVEKVEISINGGEWVVVTGIDSWNYEWDSTTVKNGDYEIKVTAFDGEDYSEEVVWNVKVDNKDDDDDGPGFGIAGILLILFWCTYAFRKKKT